MNQKQILHIIKKYQLKDGIMYRYKDNKTNRYFYGREEVIKAKFSLDENQFSEMTTEAKIIKKNFKINTFEKYQNSKKKIKNKKDTLKRKYYNEKVINNKYTCLFDAFEQLFPDVVFPLTIRKLIFPKTNLSEQLEIINDFLIKRFNLKLKQLDVIENASVKDLLEKFKQVSNYLVNMYHSSWDSEPEPERFFWHLIAIKNKRILMDKSRYVEILGMTDKKGKTEKEFKFVPIMVEEAHEEPVGLTKKKRKRLNNIY